MATREPEFSIPPPVEPMLAKLADELPNEGAFLYEPKWDGFRSIVFRRGPELFIQSRDLRPLDRYFPELARRASCRPARRLCRRRRDRHCDGSMASTSTRSSCGFTLPRHASPSWRKRRRPNSSPSTFSPSKAVTSAAKPRPSDGGPRAGVGRRQAAHPPHAGDARPRPRHRLARPVRRGRPRRRHRQARERALPAGQARHVEDQHARTAECVVAGFRWHKEGKGTHVGSLLLGLYDGKGRCTTSA